MHHTDFQNLDTKHVILISIQANPRFYDTRKLGLPHTLHFCLNNKSGHGLR